MIVAGIGCKKGVPADRIVAAINTTLAEYGIQQSDLGLLAAGDLKRDELGLSEAAALLDLPLLVLDEARLKAAAPKCQSVSLTSLKVTGIPSLSEAAAIVAAGPKGRLLGPRIAFDGVTCALGITAWSAISGGSAE